MIPAEEFVRGRLHEVREYSGPSMRQHGPTKEEYPVMKSLGHRSNQVAVFVSVLLLSTSVALGQTASLALSSTSAVAGGTATLSLALTSAAGSNPAGLQWTFSYPSASV